MKLLYIRRCCIASSQLVKQGGKVAFVHRPGRFIEIVTLMRKYKLNRNEIRFVYPKDGKRSKYVVN